MTIADVGFDVRFTITILLYHTAPLVFVVLKDHTP